MATKVNYISFMYKKLQVSIQSLVGPCDLWLCGRKPNPYTLSEATTSNKLRTTLFPNESFVYLASSNKFAGRRLGIAKSAVCWKYLGPDSKTSASSTYQAHLGILNEKWSDGLIRRSSPESKTSKPIVQTLKYKCRRS